MTLRQLWKRIARSTKLLVFACTALAFTAPATSYAQGKSGNTPAALKSNGKGSNGKVHRPQLNPDKGTAPVPEPGTWVAMASLAAIAALLLTRQRRQNAAG